MISTAIIKRFLLDRDKWVMFYIPAIIILAFVLNTHFNFFVFNLSESTWYYLTSTIIQSLAATLAIGGAFFTFKMLGVSEKIENYRDRITGFMVRTESNKESNFHELSDDGLYAKFKDVILKYKPDHYQVMMEFFVRWEGRQLHGNYQLEALNNWEKLFGSYLNIKKETLEFLRESVKLMGSTIVITALTMLVGDSLDMVIPTILVILTVLFSVSIYYISTRIVKIVR